MADITIKTNTSGLTSNRYSEFFNKKLLHHAIQQTRLADVSTQFDLPANVGSTTMRMYKRSEAASSTVETLTEGTPSSNFSNSEVTPIDIVLTQYGEKVKISDTRLKTDLINQLKMETERMGEAAAYKADEIIRDAIVLECMYNGTTAITSSGYNIFCGHGKVDTGNSAATLETAWDSFKALAESDAKITTAHLRNAATQLRKKRALPFEGGSFMAVLAPEQIDDLQKDGSWNAVNVYAGSEKIYKGEIGKFAGVKVIDWTLAFKQLSSAASFGTYASTGNVYTGFVFGREAVGCMKLAGSTSPLVPKFIINDQPDKTDLLNQYVAAGWKGYFAAKVLDKNWIVSIHSKSTFDVE